MDECRPGLTRLICLVVFVPVSLAESTEPPDLVVKPPARVEFRRQPGLVVFDAKGEVLIAAGDGVVRQWTWPTLHKLKGWDWESTIPWSEAKVAVDVAAGRFVDAWRENHKVRTVAVYDSYPDTRPNFVQVMRFFPTALVGIRRDADVISYCVANAAPAKPRPKHAWRPLELPERDVEAQPWFVWEMSPDGRTLAGWGRFSNRPAPAESEGRASAAGDFPTTALYLWNIADGKLVRRVAIRDPGSDENLPFAETARLAFSADGKTLVLNGSRTLHTIDVVSGTRLCRFGTWDPLASTPVFSPDGNLLAAATTKEYVLVWHVPSGTIRGQIAPPKRTQPKEGYVDPVGCLAFSPDGKTLAVGRLDEILLFPLELHNARPRAVLSDADAASLWRDLAAEDGCRAYRAMLTLETDPDAVACLLKPRLKATPPVDAGHVRHLVLDLEAPQFRVRRDAMKALADLADLAEPALRGRLTERPSLEAQRRIDDLLGRLADPRRFTPWLRELRAIEVLERLNTPGARDTLTALSKGGDGHRVTEHARDALRRLTANRVTAKSAKHLPIPDKTLPSCAFSRLGSLCFRHAAPVTFLSYGPGGKTLTTSDDVAVHVWNVATGGRVARLDLQNSARVVSNARTVVICKHRRLELLDVRTSKTRVLTLAEKDVPTSDEMTSCLGISTDGTRIGLTFVGPDREQVVRIWDAENGRLVRELPPLRADALGMTPDGSALLVTNAEGIGELRSVSDGSVLQTLGNLWAGEFSRDATLLAAFTAPGLRCVDVGSGKALLELADQEVFAAAFSWDSALLAVSLCGGVELWDPRAGKKVRAVSLPIVPGRLAFSPDGRTLAVATQRAVTFLDVATGQVRDADGHVDPVRALAFSPDGSNLASLAANGPALLWRQGRRPRPLFPDGVALDRGTPGPDALAGFNPPALSVLAFDEGGHRLYAANEAGAYVLKPGLDEVRARAVSRQHADAFLSCGATTTLSTRRLFPWSQLVARADPNTGTICLRDLETGAKLRELSWLRPDQDVLPTSHAPVVGTSPNGGVLAGFGRNGRSQATLWLWEIASGQTRAAYRLPVPIELTEGAFNPSNFYDTSSLTFAPDGRLIALENHGNVYLWDTRAERIVRHLFGRGRVLGRRQTARRPHKERGAPVRRRQRPHPRRSR